MPCQTMCRHSVCVYLNSAINRDVPFNQVVTYTHFNLQLTTRWRMFNEWQIATIDLVPQCRSSSSSSSSLSFVFIYLYILARWQHLITCMFQIVLHLFLLFALIFDLIELMMIFDSSKHNGTFYSSITYLYLIMEVASNQQLNLYLSIYLSVFLTAINKNSINNLKTDLFFYCPQFNCLIQS